METNWVDRLEIKYLNAGRREGRREGRAEGREEERMESLRNLQQLLLRQLALRFGPLPDAVRGKVESISSVARLNRLAEKVVVARSLEELRLA